MSETVLQAPADRLAALGRALVESRRYASESSEELSRAWRDATGALEDEQRQAAVEQVDALLVGPQLSDAALSEAPTAGGGKVQSLLKQRAGLELKLQSEAKKTKETAAKLDKQRDEHKQALESLSLQQRRIKELEQERSKLLTETSRLESQWRLQVNETEQAKLQYDKLKSSRQTLGDQATSQTERITELEVENERLKKQVESTLRERDTKVTSAEADADQAEAQSSSAAFGRVWSRLREQIPDLFLETHMPNEQTFERLGDTYVEFMRVLATLEMHVHHLMRDLRQVSERSDKLNHFYIMFTKNPGLVDTLRGYLATGKRKGNFVNLLRAQQAWARAFATGTYKVIVRSPVLIAEELNHKSWPIKTGFTVTEDAAIGKYYKETAVKTIPEKLGTEFRKHAAEMSYEDYDSLMKRHK